MSLPDSVDRWLESLVGWLDARRAGTPLRVISYLIVGAIPTGIVWIDDPSPWWLLPFLLALGATWILQHYHMGSIASRLTRRFGGVSATFAGAIEDLAHMVKHANRRALTDEQVRSECIALLHRIRDFAAVSLGVDDHPKLRATLAVPIADEDGVIRTLRTWCYDSTHSTRNYSSIDVYNADGTPRAGSPAAYHSGIDGFSIIPDVAEMRGRKPARLPYRSVASFSVPMVGSNGKPLAVVNIDASVPRFFDTEVVGARVRPHIGPVLAAIGLVLTLRRKEGGYGFPH